MTDVYLYTDPSLTYVAHISAPELAGFTERHKYRIHARDLLRTQNLLEKLRKSEVKGIVIGMVRGWPGLGCLRFTRNALRTGRRVFFYWPDEEAVECIDAERLRSFYRHWVVACVYAYIALPVLRRLGKEPPTPAAVVPALAPAALAPAPLVAPPTIVVEEPGIPTPINPTPTARDPLERAYLDCVTKLIRNANPVPLKVEQSGDGFRIRGKGVYLRTDFWAPISSGGSYGHTCYLAKELADVSDGFVCFLPHRYNLLDDLKLHQVVLPEYPYQGELSILRASAYYGGILRTTLDALRPAFIYERICLGNYVGAQLSQELHIPYIVEYNGSEIMMKRSFDTGPYEFEECYLAAETAAFQQATLISVVSDAIKEDLVKRGVPGSKILVNPNGADLDAYAPVSHEAKLSLRKAFGWNGVDRIVGFTGTFGGWHGIDVLAQAIPKICDRVPEAKFLLIGDGQNKKLVDEEIAKHKLSGRVHCTGRVPQQQGAAFLRLCDVYVSPHSRHMVGSRFFGSPTKIFEYMAMGGGIVASDLEQIGEVLSPALHAPQLGQTDVLVSNERAVLCKPGNVDEFVDAVEFLLNRPDLCRELGHNARQAVVENYSWERHVQRVCAALGNGVEPEHIAVASAPEVHIAASIADEVQEAPPEREIARVEDAYKVETQKQWDNDPCGSHYVKEAPRHTLDWFLEAQAYRYGEYAPWMQDVMEFDGHNGERVLEIGSGMGTDLAQFARHGAHVTDIDLSRGHLELARENFKLRGLEGEFIHTDAESVPFADNSFDVVYSNGVIHHTPNTAHVVEEIFRVLRPGGRAIVMVYAENSWHYWLQLVCRLGLYSGLLDKWSMGEIMSRHVELGADARPLVKVYTKERLRNLFRGFSEIQIVQRQLTPPEIPLILRKVLSAETAGKLAGWNLIVKARKPSPN